jgi:large subunit ribosomal protein L28
MLKISHNGVFLLFLKGIFMSIQCVLCGKRAQKGHKVSHSNIKTRKFSMPNLQSLRVVTNGTVRRIRACASCVKTYTNKDLARSLSIS